MLVLTIGQKDGIVVGEGDQACVIRLGKITGGRAKVIIEGPRHIRVDRLKVRQRILAELAAKPASEAEKPKLVSDQKHVLA